MTNDGRRARIILRSTLVALVVTWLFSGTVRAQVPTVVPLLALIAIELEIAIGAYRERGTASTRRDLPGAEDADLGFGELVEDELGVRLVPPPPRPERRPRDRWPLALGLIAFIAVIAVSVVDDRATTWAALPRTTREATRQRLQAEASLIAGHQVRLVCSDDSGFVGVRSDALGVAYPSREVTYLRTSVCRDLYDVIREKSAHGDRRAESILVLAHEAVHLGGEQRESVTECLALQAGVELGRRLGLSEDVAARVMRGQYLTDLADRSLIRLEYRLPGSCHDGGALDQSPGTSRFP